jgi:hypothetical protein
MYAIKKNLAASFWRELYFRNPNLASFGALNFLGFLILLTFSFFDDRTFLGINVWIKPMKFFISIGIFAFTMTWFLHYLPQIRKVKIITYGIIGVFVLEMAIILGQAALGKGSHFNIATPLDGMLFQIMGIAILINTILVFWAFWLFKKVEKIPKGYYWSIRLGMIIFIFASLEGYVMAENMGHTVGAADGVEGWFFLNWAKQYGDLRVAHFLGLHALQVVPLFGWFFSREQVKPVLWFALGYGLLSVAVFWQALAGMPLIFMN